MARKPKEIPNCQTCGACCVSIVEDNEIWAEVLVEDCERLGESWCRRNCLGHGTLHILTQALDGGSRYLGGIKTKWRKILCGPFKGVSVCACVALRGSLMHKTSCSVYEKRPHVCRTALQPGEKDCLQLRRMFWSAVEDL